ncbi:MAG TPA: 16S rRNA (cytidine(1402)-2'-O)-methyltransferase [Candidatus Saccharimonadales bacterium]|jgi:16S rRNA (cytidine1402-2'-O)-methyltransferase|nr:16S rRNA (cytidine(1402)-2'-O)-methyltransferase [Candidatus Saccharimonadales bacterium]
MTQAISKGTLYLVATPIGNLEDISFRAVSILKQAGLIACEDTRQTAKLLNHYGIETPTISYHEHNELRRAQELITRLKDGVPVALVSDAGMPGISDPGYRVVTMALEQGIPVVPIPGASAALSALAASGLPTDAFEFRGFLPARSGQRRTALEELRATVHTVIVYEAPHRIMETLEDIVELLGPHRPVVIAREMTKMYEEFIRGGAGEVLEQVRGRDLKGEITLLIGKAGEQATIGEVEEQDLRTRLAAIMREQQLDEKAALKALAKERGMGKSELYRELQRGKTSPSRKK